MLSCLSTSVNKYYKLFPPDPNLVQYFDFNTIYNSTGGPWTSGDYYVANTASGTIGPLYKAHDENAYPSTTGSIYGKNSTWRNTINNYTFPQNTGLSFSIWVYMINQTPYSHAGVFGYADSTGTQSVALRMVGNGTNNQPPFSPPYSINLCVDNSIPPTEGGTTVPGYTLDANTWYHIVWTISPAAYDATATHKVYLNNSLIYTNTELKYPGNYLRVYQDICSMAGNGSNEAYIDTFRHYRVEIGADGVNYLYTYLDPHNIIV